MNPHAYWLAAPLLALLIFTPLAHTTPQTAEGARRQPLRAVFIQRCEGTLGND